MVKTLESVMEYKSKHVLKRFLKMHDLPRHKAELIFEDTKRYLWLNAKIAEKRALGKDVPDVYISKSMVIIDEMWHTFILNTREYIAFCEKHFGEFVHHPPDCPKYFNNLKKLGEEKTNEILLEEMIALVFDHFGEEVSMRWFNTYHKYAHLNIVH